jgi:hypothetical protein
MAGKKIWVTVGTIAVFVIYVAWMLGPYIRSVIVRDAAVTTWSRTAVAPIAGRIETDLPEAGTMVGKNGQIATIRNNLLLLETQAVETTRDRVIALRSRIKETEEFLAELGKLERDRIATKERLIAVFRSQLNAESDNLRAEIKVNVKQIAVLRRIVKRHQSLVGRGAGSVASLDEALLRVAAMEARQSELRASLKNIAVRQKSANDGVYITASGETPDWVRQSEFELQIEIRRAQHQMHVAQSELVEAEKDLVSQSGKLGKLTEAAVTAPPGTLIHSVLVAAGSRVTPGHAIVEWIDCANLMVDVPVSDAELPLLRRGAKASIVLEGEPQEREGTVLLTRGSSATLGRVDLAAVAKGREPGVAQVLLTLKADGSQFELCPVGRAAYVEFPGVGMIDVLRARLRL